MKKFGMILALLVASTASADTLLIEGLNAESSSASNRPTRGMSMANVEARYGAPSARVAAIGEPPISRWEYPEFVVYFEYDHVVHAVVRR